MPSFKLGKHVPRRDPRTLRFGRYLTPALPPPPASATLYTDVRTWPMMGNDRYGDCTMAGAGHLVEEWTAQTDPAPDVIPDATVESDYFKLTGGRDNGLDLLTVLNWWRQTGFVDAAGALHPIRAYANLEPQNDTELRDAVSIFGGAYLGLALPNFAVNPPDGNLLDVPWVVPPGGVSANPAVPTNGHAVAAVGYDARNVYVVTWGAVKTMSYPFYAAYADEAFAIVSPDWLKQGMSPPGFDLQQLQQDLAAINAAPSAPSTGS